MKSMAVYVNLAYGNFLSILRGHVHRHTNHWLDQPVVEKLPILWLVQTVSIYSIYPLTLCLLADDSVKGPL